MFKKANEKEKQMKQAMDILSIYVSAPLSMSFVGIFIKDKSINATH